MPLDSRRFSRTAAGFSLIELLVVLAIMALLASFSVSAISGTSSSRQLNAGGNKTVSLINLARQNAITTHKMTALILLTGTNNPAIDNRVFILEQFDPVTAAWQKASSWKLLPPNVVAEIDDTFKSPAPSVLPPTLNYLGQSIGPTQYAYQIFLPRGELFSNGTTTPPLIKLVSGVMNNGNVTYTSQHASGSAANYYDVTINLYTGMPKVFRP